MHLDGLPLADPDFGLPGRIDALLNVDVFIDTLLSGRCSGPPWSPVAFETEFGWVLGGSLDDPLPPYLSLVIALLSHHLTTTFASFGR